MKPFLIGAGILIVLLVGYALGRTPLASSDSSAGQASPAAVAVNDDSAATDAPTEAPTPKPKPTATPESYAHQRQREKREFIASVNESITADKISGNPSKYVGDAVELHCTVSNVPQQGVVNAACGDDDTNIVLEYDDTNSLDQGQAVRVLGTVDDPQDGTNAMGGSMSFPTVKVEFME